MTGPGSTEIAAWFSKNEPEDCWLVIATLWLVTTGVALPKAIDRVLRASNNPLAATPAPGSLAAMLLGSGETVSRGVWRRNLGAKADTEQFQAEPLAIGDVLPNVLRQCPRLHDGLARLAQGAQAAMQGKDVPPVLSRAFGRCWQCPHRTHDQSGV